MDLNRNSVLGCLTRARLLELGRQLECGVHTKMSRDELVNAMRRTNGHDLEQLLATLRREELRDVCRMHSVATTARPKRQMINDLLATKQRVAARGRAQTTKPGGARQAASSKSGRASDTRQPGRASNRTTRRRSAMRCSAAQESFVDMGRGGGNDMAGFGGGPGEQPKTRDVLGMLTKPRLVNLGRIFEVALNERQPKPTLVDRLRNVGRVGFTALLPELKRDELRKACSVYGLQPHGDTKAALIETLTQARRYDEAASSSTFLSSPAQDNDALPRKGDIVVARSRQYLVEDVETGKSADEELDASHLVKLVCLDDDDSGRRLDLLWGLELGARVIRPEAGVLPNLQGLQTLDEPRSFAGYLQALQWNAVTAADAKLLQAPFRAGIKIEAFQLIPLIKALALPRTNLAIFDDVGLGKTIEAGLVMQELLLRQQVDYVLVVAPSSVCLQWQEEMRKRFGLFFEVYDRKFMARRRKERGYAVNPWSTHNRFIVPYSLLRRPEHLEPLVASLGDRRRKSLLILDEAHTIAPASSGGKYALDSRITRVIRDQVANRFDNRLFLTATPHNGHSNSFSALLEVLDPQRFSRGVPIRSADELKPVMVRRLKQDIRALGAGAFPQRKVVQIDVWRSDGAWLTDSGTGVQRLGASPGVELELSRLLTEYMNVVKPKSKRARLVLVGLQKRLLSSVPAFGRTLRRHAETFDQRFAEADVRHDVRSPNAGNEAANDSHDESVDDELDPSDEVLAAEEDSRIAEGSRDIEAPAGPARKLLERMVALSQQGRLLPDARVLALFAWMREHMCPAVGDTAKGVARDWTSRRVIIFTEAVDTKRYLRQLLDHAIAHTREGDLRILELHGGMGDDRREEVQRAFNQADHPVRILLATDAAREGINLQGQCADLFHFDIPWNPGRMEQRNGRIDRTLQPAAEVRCHYFFYRDRPEDIVLKAIAQKVETIGRELGSLGTVVHDAITEELEESGIGSATAARIEARATSKPGVEVVQAELEGARERETKALSKEIAAAHALAVDSRKRLSFDTDSLRQTINAGLRLMGAGELEALPTPSNDDAPAYRLPALGSGWDETLDTLRAPRGRDESLWDWRKRPPQPVVFEPPKEMTSPSVHLHLHHPFVQRVLDRFLAQGYSAHDLHRVTVVRDKDARVPLAIAIGRLSLFGRGAVRLHDQLVAVSAEWDADETPTASTPEHKRGNKDTTAALLEQLDRLFRNPRALMPVAARVEKSLALTAVRDFGALWAEVQEMTRDAATEAKQRLAERADIESKGLSRILERQRVAVAKAIEQLHPRQLELAGVSAKADFAQAEDDRKYLERRVQTLAHELEHEPKALRELYEVQLERIDPVGLVYVYPDGIAGKR